MNKQRNLDSLLIEGMRIEKKILCRDFQRRLQLEMVETDFERQLNQKKSEGLIEKDNKGNQFNTEMMKLKIEEQNEAKLCLSLCQNSPDLRELKSKMNRAHIGKQVLAQINHKRAASVKEKLDLQDFEDVMKTKLALSENLESHKFEEAIAQKLKYKEDLLNQIKQSDKKRVMNNEFLRDKEMLEFTLESIKQQNKKEEEIRVKKFNKLKQDIEEINTLKNHYDQLKKQMSDDDDRKIKHYKDQKEKKQKESNEKRKEMEKQKEQRQEKLYSNFVPRFDKSDKEEILHYLAEEELEENYLKRKEKELVKSLQWREELQRYTKQQYEEKIKSLEEKKLHELNYKKQLEEEMEKDGHIAQIALERKHQTMLEYRNQLKEQLEDKHRRQIECWQREKALEKLRESEESERENLVDEKCKQILIKHTPQFTQMSSK